MTGFARADAAAAGYGWSWELRSVNARGLDLRLRLPPGMERIEPAIRTAAAARLKRGTVTANLTLTKDPAGSRLVVNEAVLDQVVALAADLAGRLDAERPRIDGLLAIRGVLEPAEEAQTDEARAALDKALLASFDAALDRLIGVRNEEGARLAALAAGYIDEIGRLAGAARETAALQPAALDARLREQVAALVEADPRLSEERIAQEVALLVVRSDVREELDRLDAHVAAAGELLASDEAIGRQLDFLCQEFNREANTVCSKASDIDLTRIGLDLKTAIDRLREQIQNVE